MSKESNRWFRVISYVLCIALMVTIMPMQVFADEINTSQEQTGTTELLVPGSSRIPHEEPVIDNTPKPEAQIVSEVVGKREENIKHFKMNDGTYIAAEYEEPVHYLQNGKWEDIDNTLTEQNAIDSSDFNGYENTKNNFKIKLSKTYNEEQLVSIKQGQYSLSWRFLNHEDHNLLNFFSLWKNVSLRNTSENKETGNQSFLKKTKLSSSVKYENTISGVDLEYVLNSANVKENIIVKQKLNSYDFSFGYKAQGLKAVLNNDGSISFVDDKTSEVVFETPAPYMYDAAGQESLDVKYTLEETAEGCNITVSADPNWMNAPERAFPVTIDPQILTKSGPQNTVEGFTATSGSVSPRSFSTGHMYVGNEVNYGRCRIYIKNDLPTLTQQDMVVGATMTVIQTADGYSGSSGSLVLNAYEIKGNWDAATITDSNAPSLGPILDYNTVSSANNSNLPSFVGYVNFNITKAVKGWYEGTSTNYGIAIRSNNESELNRSRYYTSDHPDITNAGPCITIQYVNNMGLEDYWSYHTQSVGRAGTGSVNDYTGNLVFEHGDLALNGSRLPVNLSHVYNSKKSNASFFPLANGYQGLNTGRGWQLNVTQRVDATTGDLAATYPYFYTDEDGTIHYFMLKSGYTDVWVDEDGLGYELTRPTVDGSVIYQIKDKAGNLLKFTPWGYLQYVQDNNGNTMSLAYTGAILSTITDGAGRVTTLVANEYGYLTKIIDPSNRETLFGYSGQLLTTITYPDGTQTLYGYDASGNLSSVTSPDGYKVNYTHASSPKSGPRVAQIDERGKNNEYGGSMRITYSANKSSTFEDPGDDYSYTTPADNYFVTYNFDNAGRAINVSDQYGNAEMYGYSDASDSSRNKVTSSAVSNESVFNLTKDSSSENNTSWSAGVWQTGSGNTYSSARSTENPYIGTTSFKITNAPAGSNSCYPYYMQQVSITKKNTYYTFSAYVKTSLTSNRSAGAILSAYLLESGATTYYSSTTTSADWERLTVTFFVPSTSTATAVAVMFGIKDETGTAWFDCAQLEEGNTANRYNLLENSSFENVTSQIPTAWTGTNLAAGTDIVTTGGKIDTNAMKIIGSQTVNKGLSQTVVTGGTESDCYVISGWGKADSVPLTSGRYYAMDVGIRYTDSTTVWKAFNFNADNTNWQYLSAVFNCSDNNSSTNKNVSAIYVYILYYSNANTAYFDGLQLNKDESNSYSYDANGNLVSTVDIARTSSTFDYSGENELVKNMNPEGGSYNYAYDSVNKHRLLFATSEVGSRYAFDYDSYGNATKTGIQNDANSTAVVSGRTYYIRAKNSGKYLEVQNSSDTDGATVIQNAYTGGTNQQWMVTDIGGGYYRLTPKNSSTRSLDVYNGNTTDNTKIQIWNSSGTNAQQFKITPNNDSTYKITTKVTTNGSSLTVKDANNNPADVVEFSDSGATHQKWYFEDVNASAAPADGKIYTLRSRHSGQYFDVTGGSDTEGTKLVQYYFGGATNQKFMLQSSTDGYFKLRSLINDSGKFVTAEADNTLALRSDNGLSSQEFKFIVQPNGSYRIVTRASADASCVEDPGSSYTSGTGLTVAVNGSGISQQWVLEAATKSITSEASYTSNSNYLNILTDARGNTTDYNYDSNKGVLNSVEDPNGVLTSYTYNPDNDNLESVSKGGASSRYTYENGQLTSIKPHAGDDVYAYSFAYDGFGNVKTVDVGTQRLVTNTYRSYNQSLDYSTYGNGYKVGYTYDSFDRVTEKKYNDTVRFKYTYDKEGNLYSSQNLQANTTYSYAYDLAKRLKSVSGSDGHRMKFVYDTKNRLADFFNIFDTTSYKTNYVYGSAATQSPTLIYGIKLNDVQKLSYAYDSLARLTTKTINGANNYAVNYSYEDVSDSKTTTLLSSINNGGSTLSYTYDKLGNIETISENGNLKATYHYDELSQLTREDSLWQDETLVYAYDVGGNILSKTTYAYTDPAVEPANATDTINYTYGDSNWKDKLTAYNGQSITYDEIGNMLSFGTKTFTWEGRQLTALSDSGSGDSLTYQYNDSGIRTKKVYNGVMTNYYLNGSDVVRETNGTDTLDYFYDADGNLYGFKLNGTEYYYIRNGQNDITGILDTSGSEVVSYSYDTWGKLLGITGSLADTVGVKNPYRYRGYRYDTETGMYYLNSRYYDPVTYRMLNADAAVGQVGSILSHNMFTYCFNNPVSLSDPTGYWPKLSTILTVVAVAAFTVAIVVATCGAAAPIFAAVGGGIIAGEGLAAGAFITSGIAAAGAIVSKAVETVTDKTLKQNNSVYVLKDSNGTVQYVGRTIDVNKRQKAHEKNPARAGLDMEVIQPNLNLAQARAVEQAAMAYYHTLNTMNKMNNQINGIAPKYWGAYKEVAVGMLDYGWNQVSNEILYWTGN